jgi:hypothetical protein
MVGSTTERTICPWRANSPTREAGGKQTKDCMNQYIIANLLSLGRKRTHWEHVSNGSACFGNERGAADELNLKDKQAARIQKQPERAFLNKRTAGVQGVESVCSLRAQSAACSVPLLLWLQACDTEMGKECLLSRLECHVVMDSITGWVSKGLASSSSSSVQFSSKQFPSCLLHTHHVQRLIWGIER